jgi:hypothetical protein
MDLRTLVMPDLDPVQYAEIVHPARFKVWPWGRRRGKSSNVVCAGAGCAWEGGFSWWILPSHTIGQPAWRVLRSFGNQLRAGYEGVEIKVVEKMVLMPSGGFVQIRSADDPQALVAEGIDLAIFDEGGLHKIVSWEESVQPTLMDRMGRAIICGVPKGTQGLLWYGWQRAIDPLATDWHGLHQTTFDAPNLPQPAKDAILADYKAGRISERYFRQEYMAEFLSAEGEVFRNIMAVATGEAQENGRDGAHHVIGVDWGKRHDFTVFSVWDSQERRQVYLDRFRGVTYQLARERLAGVAQRFPGVIVAEDTGVGDPVVEGLESMGLNVQRFHTTADTKRIAVERLALAFENQKLSILLDPLQVAELQSFEAKTSPSGKTRYAGPDSGHDDTVMAMVFAWSDIDPADGGFGAVLL